MAKTKEQKIEAVKKLADIAKASESVVFVNFSGLSVEDETKLRRTLRGENSSYKVVKKTLLKLAFGQSSVKGDLPELEGMVAIAYGDDMIAPARGVYEFQKTHKDMVNIVGGVFEGKYMNQEEMMSIATIPSMPVLYGQFVNLINSPIQQFVSALGQIAEKREA